MDPLRSAQELFARVALLHGSTALDAGALHARTSPFLLLLLGTMRPHARWFSTDPWTSTRTWTIPGAGEWVLGMEMATITVDMETRVVPPLAAWILSAFSSSPILSLYRSAR
jgi:hypothetical protein